MVEPIASAKIARKTHTANPEPSDIIRSAQRGESIITYSATELTEFDIEKVPGLRSLLARKLVAQLLAPLVAVLLCCGSSSNLSCPRLACPSGCGRCMLLIETFLGFGSLGHSWSGANGKGVITRYGDYCKILLLCSQRIWWCQFAA